MQFGFRGVNDGEGNVNRQPLAVSRRLDRDRSYASTKLKQGAASFVAVARELSYWRFGIGRTRSRCVWALFKLIS
jgi:hypothetical protein